MIVMMIMMIIIPAHLLVAKEMFLEVPGLLVLL